MNKTMKFTVSAVNSNAGKTYKFDFRTGIHDRKRKNAKRDRREWSQKGRKEW